MQTIWDSSLWYTNPKAYWTIQYEYRRSGNDMQYRFYWKVWLGSYSWYDDAFTLRLFLNGVQNDVAVKGVTSSLKGWSYDGTTEWYTVPNKISGTVPFYAQMYNVSAIKVDATSGSHSLNVSPAGATMTSAIDFTDEGNPSFTFSNPANAVLKCWLEPNPVSIPHLCERTISGTSGTYTWELTESERNQLREACKGNSCTCRIGLHSTLDGAEFDSYFDKTLTIVNANPIFTASQISYTDVNKVLYGISGNEDDNQKIVQNKSSLSVTFGAASGNKGATIKEYSLTFNGVTKTESTNGTVSFGIINASQSGKLSVTVKDSRGNTTTVEKEITVLAWALPIFTATIARKNNYEDETTLRVDASISSVDGKNYIKSITYQYMEVGGSYGQPIPIDNETDYTINKDADGNAILDKTKGFFFLITVEDAFDHDNKELYLAKGTFPFFIDTKKNSVGINKFPAEERSLEATGMICLGAREEIYLEVGESIEIPIYLNSCSGLVNFRMQADGLEISRLFYVFRVNQNFGTHHELTNLSVANTSSYVPVETENADDCYSFRFTNNYTKGLFLNYGILNLC